VTKNQKWLKGLVGGDPKPKTAARWWKRGPNYRAQFAVAHETKRAAKEAAQAAKKGAR